MLATSRLKNAIRGIALISGFLASANLPLAAEGPSALAGIWVGDLKIQGQALPLVFTVSEEGGLLKATIDSPSQGAKGIPVSAVSIDKGSVRIESKVIKAEFSGTLSPDGKKIEGKWAQGGMSLPLALEKRDSAPSAARTQEPKPPFPYKTEEVVVENRKAGIKLAGTLVIPANHANGSGEGPFPAVVFATGSGPQNRDEELLGHRPFLVIADYLARRGIASLRCDDRGVGASTGDFASATTFDNADDVEAAFEYLAARPEAKKGAVGIIGHSEGGLIAPIVASRNAKVAFAVLLAGPGIRGEELLYLQGRLIAEAGGETDEAIARAMEINRRLYGIAGGQGSEAEVKAQAKKALLDWLDADRAMKPEDRAAARQHADDSAAQLASPWFRAFLRLDPVPYLAATSIPVLALNGGKDLQVPPKEDLGGIKAALGKGVVAGANKKSAFVELPGLNHLFQHSNTGSPSEYASIEETFAPEALKAIADWIHGL